MTLSSLLSVYFFIFEEEMDFYKFKKSDKLTCTESLMIKLSTAILLLVEVEPSVWSANLISEKYSSFYLFHILIYTWVQCLNFVDTCAFEDQNGTKRNVSRPLTKAADGNISF